MTAADVAYVEANYLSFEEACAGRAEALEQVRAVAAAGQLPQPSYVLPEVPGASDGGSPHSAGVRTIYVSALPDAGSAEFATGTMIVKVSGFNTFAMHKRGGTYNANGARGWEWLELEKTSTGEVESLEVLFFSTRLLRKDIFELPITAELHLTASG